MEVQEGNDSVVMEDAEHSGTDLNRICQTFLPVPTTTTGFSTTRARSRRSATRIVCMSDTHGSHESFAHVPSGDVLVHAGDFTQAGELGTVQSLDRYFQNQSSRFAHIICIAGNHDVTFHESYYGPPQDKWRRFHRRPFDASQCRAALRHCTYLEDSGCDVRLNISAGGLLRFYGSPWTIEFYDWAFNLPKDRMSAEAWERIPDAVDVLVTHGPPFGRCDETTCGTKAGCPHLLRHVQDRVRPRLHVFGHIHEGRGASFDGRTLYVNASSVDDRYRPSNPCFVVDVPHDPAQAACIVEPRCTIDDLELWLRNSPYRQLQGYASQVGGDKATLPSHNDLVGPDAFEVVAGALGLHRDAAAQAELRLALLHIHAEAFDRLDDL
jgi:Icc-related predicted phosphoesterase